MLGRVVQIYPDKLLIIEDNEGNQYIRNVTEVQLQSGFFPWTISIDDTVSFDATPPKGKAQITIEPIE